MCEYLEKFKQIAPKGGFVARRCQLVKHNFLFGYVVDHRIHFEFDYGREEWRCELYLGFRYIHNHNSALTKNPVFRSVYWHGLSKRNAFNGAIRELIGPNGYEIFIDKESFLRAHGDNPKAVGLIVEIG